MGHIEGMDMVCASLAFIDGVGGPEMVLIFVVVLVLFGGQKLPEFARGLGKTMREFKKAASGVEEEFKRALEEDERKTNAAKLAAAPADPAPATDEYMDPHYDSGGPDSEVQSPVTDGHGATEGDPYAHDGTETASPNPDDGTLGHDDGGTAVEEEPKIMPPASTSAAAPKPPAPPPGALENPS